MTTRNLQELALAVMHRLSSSDIQDSAVGARELDIITKRYEEKFAELKFEGLAYWTSTAIPLEAFNAIVRIVAHEAAAPLGEAIPEEQEADGAGPAQQIGVIGMKMLRKHMRRRMSGQPTVGEYF